jgi:hypothetical protein
MEHFALPYWFGWLAIGWLVFVIILSIIFRKSAGKSIFPIAPIEALFAERGASSGMASRCLLVVITETELIVTPTFPFNLMFLPQFYGLEHTIAIADISKVEAQNKLFGYNASVFYRSNRILRLK